MRGYEETRYRNEPYPPRGARDGRGSDARVDERLRPDFDEEDTARRREAGDAERRRARHADRLYHRNYGPYDYGWASDDREGPFEGRGPKGYQRSDERIYDDVCDRLTASPDIDASDVEVTVNNGEVTLTGSVPTRDQKRESEYVAEDVTGVRDVRNALRVNQVSATTNVGP